MQLKRLEVWRAAVTINLIFLISRVSGMVAYPVPAHSSLMHARMVQLVWCLSLVVVLLLDRRSISLRTCLAAYGLSCVPQFLIFWATAVARESTGDSWEPLMRQKVVCLVVAVLSPGELWVSGAIMLAVAIEACVEFRWGLVGASEHLTVGEPWLTVAMAGLCFGLLLYRRRQIAHQRGLEQRSREADALERLARVSLAVRDLANTPIQTLEISVALLRDRYPEAAQQCARMQRALDRLHELNRLLSPYESNIRWRAELTSLDSASLIANPTGPLEPS